MDMQLSSIWGSVSFMEYFHVGFYFIISSALTQSFSLSLFAKFYTAKTIVDSTATVCGSPLYMAVSLVSTTFLSIMEQNT